MHLPQVLSSIIPSDMLLRIDHGIEHPHEVGGDLLVHLLQATILPVPESAYLVGTSLWQAGQRHLGTVLNLDDATLNRTIQSEALRGKVCAVLKRMQGLIEDLPAYDASSGVFLANPDDALPFIASEKERILSAPFGVVACLNTRRELISIDKLDFDPADDPSQLVALGFERCAVRIVLFQSDKGSLQCSDVYEKVYPYFYGLGIEFSAVVGVLDGGNRCAVSRVDHCLSQPQEPNVSPGFCSNALTKQMECVRGLLDFANGAGDPLAIRQVVTDLVRQVYIERILGQRLDDPVVEKDFRTAIALGGKWRRKEALEIYFIDAKRQLKAGGTVRVGTPDNLPVNPTDILLMALAMQRRNSPESLAVVLAHNHPSGDVTISRKMNPAQQSESGDVVVTRDIKNELEGHNIILYDHYVTGGHVSCFVTASCRKEYPGIVSDLDAFDGVVSSRPSTLVRSHHVARCG